MTALRALTSLRVASRGSALALAQAALAVQALQQQDPALRINYVQITTEGDVDRSTPLSILGGRGVFVRGVEDALLEGRADIAVHSMKDVPTELAPGLTIGAVLPRGDARDVLVASGGRRLADLPAGARVGTSSQRRVAMLALMRPDIEAVEVRGNVDTRSRKVMDGELDGVLLAAAGLERLGRLAEATQLFDAQEFVPAPAQGIVAIECREDDEAVLALLATIDDARTRTAATAERAFLRALGSGCTLPVGAYARLDRDLVVLRAMIQDEAVGHPIFGDGTGASGGADALGAGMAERLTMLIDRIKAPQP